MSDSHGTLPDWAEATLQGLAYWVGYSRTRFRFGLLPEAALVVEACALIHANVSSECCVLTEPRYRKLLGPAKRPRNGWKLERVDLAVVRRKAGNEKKGSCHYRLREMIEVKRASAGHKDIVQDLSRLRRALLTAEQEVRAYLIVVTQRKRKKLDWLIRRDGTAVRGKNPLSGGDGYYRVRRVCKAAPSFESKSSAYYACLVEVLGA